MAKNISEAFSSALKFYNKDSLILVSGSFFLVAEAKEFLKMTAKPLTSAKTKNYAKAIF